MARGAPRLIDIHGRQGAPCTHVVIRRTGIGPTARAPLLRLRMIGWYAHCKANANDSHLIYIKKSDSLDPVNGMTVSRIDIGEAGSPGGLATPGIDPRATSENDPLVQVDFSSTLSSARCATNPDHRFSVSRSLPPRPPAASRAVTAQARCPTGELAVGGRAGMVERRVGPERGSAAPGVRPALMHFYEPTAMVAKTRDGQVRCVPGAGFPVFPYASGPFNNRAARASGRICAPVSARAAADSGPPRKRSDKGWRRRARHNPVATRTRACP